MAPEELLAGIRDADAHRGGIRCLRVFRLERVLGRGLRDEVLRLCESEASSDVQEREHVTHWTRPTGAVRQLSLYNRSGDSADFRSDHDLSCLGKRFHLAAPYPLLAHFVETLPHLINFRVNLLGPGAGLAPHEEHSLFITQSGSTAVRARFHLPIQTSRVSRMMLEGDRYRFAPRTIYYFNQGCVHGAENPASSARIHLVWDQLLSRDVFNLTFGSHPAPAGWRRLLGDERALRAISLGQVSSYSRLPPLTMPAEAARVGLSPVQ